MSCPDEEAVCPAPFYSFTDLSLPGKKGVCMLLKGGENIPKIKSLQPYWNYGWNHKPMFEEQPEGVEWVPMIWGKNWTPESLKEVIVSLRESGKVKRILGFNEPDQKEQSNMQVEQAHKFWHVLEELGVPLASPSCAKPEGEWMQEFMEHCNEKNCRIDYVGVHWYGNPNPTAFKNAMKKYHNMYNKPIIITEFAPADWSASCPEENKFSREKVLDFMKEVLPWLENTKWVVGYCWFPFPPDSRMGTCSALFNNKDGLTALGRYYASVTTENPKGDQSITVG